MGVIHHGPVLFEPRFWRTGVTHRKDKAEEQAIALLQRVVAMSEADRDALPGSAVKQAPGAARPDPADG